MVELFVPTQKTRCIHAGTPDHSALVELFGNFLLMTISTFVRQELVRVRVAIVVKVDGTPYTRVDTYEGTYEDERVLFTDAVASVHRCVGPFIRLCLTTLKQRELCTS